MTSSATVRDRVLRAAKAAIERGVQEGHSAACLDLTTLAARAGYSRHHFVRAFSATYGETPLRYRSRCRMERAAALLRTTELPVTEVCVHVGFGSLGTFSRRFKEYVGCAPSVYRGRHRSTAAGPEAGRRPGTVNRARWQGRSGRPGGSTVAARTVRRELRVVLAAGRWWASDRPMPVGPPRTEESN